MENKTENKIISACPQKSTLILSPAQRALGKIIGMNIADNDKARIYEFAQDLARDCFWEYFQPVPKVKDEEDVAPERIINRMLIDWAKQSPKWEVNRMRTIGSAFVSASSASVLSALLTTDEVIAELMKKQEEIEQLQKEAGEMEKEGGEEAKDGNSEAASQKFDEANDKREKAKKIAQEVANKLKERQESPTGKAIRANAISKANERSEQAEGMVKSWGLENSTEESMLEMSEIFNELQKHQGMIEQITPLMGRVKGIALSAKAKQRRTVGIIVEDGYTQNLSNLFPSELSMLRPEAPQAMRAMKMGEYADRGLLGMVEGIESTKEGGLIMAVDDSGSMGGWNTITARALALGISKAAQDNGQDFKVFTFSTKDSNSFEVDNNSTPKELIEWCKKSVGGGTDFDWALNKAIDKLKGLGEQTDNTDIVFITDGECELSKNTISLFQEFKKAHGTRLIYLQIGQNSGYKTLSEIATAILEITPDQSIDNIAERLSEAMSREKLTE